MADRLERGWIRVLVLCREFGMASSEQRFQVKHYEGLGLGCNTIEVHLVAARRCPWICAGHRTGRQVGGRHLSGILGGNAIGRPTSSSGIEEFTEK